MKASKPIAFVLLAFLLGGTASQLPFAFGDSSSTNPLQSLWDAIGALNNRQQDLQAQIDELRAEIQKDNELSAAASGVEVPQSEPSIKIELEGHDSANDQAGGSDARNTKIVMFHLTASNSGPDNAVGVKLTFFYKLGLFEIASITAVQGEQCEESSRGIVQCYIGTIGPSAEHRITIMATADVPDQEAHVAADISSITQDTDPRNNHADFTFVPNELLISSSLEPITNNSVESQSEPQASEDAGSQAEAEQQHVAENSTNDEAVNDTQEQTTENDTQVEDQSSATTEEAQSATTDESNQEQQGDAQSTSDNSETSDTGEDNRDESASQDQGSSDDSSQDQGSSDDSKV